MKSIDSSTHIHRTLLEKRWESDRPRSMTRTSHRDSIETWYWLNLFFGRRQKRIVVFFHEIGKRSGSNWNECVFEYFYLSLLVSWHVVCFFFMFNDVNNNCLMTGYLDYGCTGQRVCRLRGIPNNFVDWLCPKRIRLISHRGFLVDLDKILRVVRIRDLSKGPYGRRTLELLGLRVWRHISGFLSEIQTGNWRATQ